MAEIIYSEDGKTLVKASDIEGHFIVSDGVTMISDKAFEDCDNLTSIELPDGVTHIGKWAFQCCYNLSNIVIPNSVVEIGEGAFYECESLSFIEVPNTLTKIEDRTFWCCTNLNRIEIPFGVTAIGDEAFRGCESLINIELPNTIVSIGDYAFYNCHSLETIEFPNSVQYLGYDVFTYCCNLQRLDIPNRVLKIGLCSYEDCGIMQFNVDSNNNAYTDVDGIIYTKDLSKLVAYPTGRTDTMFVVPDSVTTLTDYSFSYSKLERVDILDNVKTLGNYLFSKCSGLKEIHLAISDPNSFEIGDRTFDKDDFDFQSVSLYVPIGCGYAYRHHPLFSKFKNVVVEKYDR